MHFLVVGEPPEASDSLGETEQFPAIQELAKEGLDNLSRAHLSFFIGGKKIVVREQVQNLFNLVLGFKSFIGSVVSSEPHCAIALAGVMIVLPVRDHLA